MILSSRCGWGLSEPNRALDSVAWATSLGAKPTPTLRCLRAIVLSILLHTGQDRFLNVPQRVEWLHQWVWIMWKDQHHSLACTGDRHVQETGSLLERLSFTTEEVPLAIHMDRRVCLPALRLMVGHQLDPAGLRVVNVYERFGLASLHHFK